MKSVEKVSSVESSTNGFKQFSFKRYFVNNVDSYHGGYYLKVMSKILEKNAIPSREPSTTIMGEDVVVAPPPPPPQPYEIIGSASDSKMKYLKNEKKSIEYVTRLVPKNECLPEMLTCGTVVLDISCDRDEIKTVAEYLKLLKLLLDKQVEAPSDINDGKSDDEPRKRYLILVSTIMTWASTKPLDPDTPDMPFVETDFRKRKPHPNYRAYYDIENEVIAIARKYRSQIGAIVVGVGVTYGGKEDILHYWFQKAWECERLLPLFGRGSNFIPIINVADLAQIVYNLILDFPKRLYILAVEQNVTKQREIIKPLGKIVGTGMFKCLPKEDAFLIPDITQRIYDLMTLNLCMEPTFIVETMGLQWTSELSFAELVPTLIKEFKKERGLKPFKTIDEAYSLLQAVMKLYLPCYENTDLLTYCVFHLSKVVVYGPPIAGKTTLSKSIAEAYGLEYISPETVVQDVTNDLEWRITHWKEGEISALPVPTGEEEDPNAGDEDDLADDEETQETARNNLLILQSGKVMTEEEILGYLRQRLISREAQNRGWVLDGFPTTMSQCAALFEKGDVVEDAEDIDATEEPDEGEQFDEDTDLYSNVLKKILPDIVVSLDVTDDYICEKAMRQPETDSRMGEEVVLRRLNEFRSGDARDVTPLNFFDELDIHPLVVPVNQHTDYAMKGPYAAVALRMGRACRYGKLIGMIEAAEKMEQKELETMRAKEEKALKALEKEMQEDREEKMEYWSELYSLMREEEEAALAAAGEPMRNYLVQHIFPTLTPALLEVANLRPDDPIDFLAEYLFKLNPSGKMLEPGYNLQAEKLLGKIKILDDALSDLDIRIDPLVVDEVDIEKALPPKRKINPMSAL